jgi:hypothetical protein
VSIAAVRSEQKGSYHELEISSSQLQPRRELRGQCVCSDRKDHLRVQKRSAFVTQTVSSAFETSCAGRAAE